MDALSSCEFKDCTTIWDLGSSLFIAPLFLVLCHLGLSVKSSVHSFHISFTISFQTLGPIHSFQTSLATCISISLTQTFHISANDHSHKHYDKHYFFTYHHFYLVLLEHKLLYDSILILSSLCIFCYNHYLD